MALIIARTPQTSFLVGEVEIILMSIVRSTAILGINAPEHIRIIRTELLIEDPLNRKIFKFFLKSGIAWTLKRTAYALTEQYLAYAELKKETGEEFGLHDFLQNHLHLEDCVKYITKGAGI